MPGIPTGNKQLQMAGLDNIGSTDAGDGVTLSSSAAKLIRIADVFIQDYKRRMQRSGNVDMGEGGDLIYAADIDIEGANMSLDIMIPEYLLFQSYGVNGTNVNHGSEFSYRDKMPPLAPLLKWARRRANRSDKYSSIQRQRNKRGMDKDRALRKRIDDADNYRSLAFAIAKGIQKNGIKPTNDLQNAGKTIERVFKKELSEGFKLDIINSLK